MSLRRRAVASRLVAAAATAAASHAGAAGTPDGAALFAQHCAACHQADASGTVGLAPSLKGAHWQRLGADRGYLLSVVLHGLSGPIVVNGQPFVGSMPPFAAQLDDAQVALVANHLRTLQGAADAPAYASDDVKRARALPGSPPASRQRRAQLLGG
jgi:mono/diheme cytochrome c family protein